MAKSKAAVAKRRRKREPSGSETDDGSEPATKKRPAAKAAAAAKTKTKAASIVKRPAAATPLGKFDLAVGVKTHIKRGAAADEPKRQNFVSKLHHRVHSDALKSCVPLGRVTAMRDFVSVNAGKVHDSVHKKVHNKGKHGKTGKHGRNTRTDDAYSLYRLSQPTSEANPPTGPDWSRLRKHRLRQPPCMSEGSMHE